MIRVALLATLTWLIPAPARGGTTITLETRPLAPVAASEPRVTRVLIEGRNLRAEGEGARHTLVFRGAAGVLEVYDHREKSVFRLDRGNVATVQRGVDQAREVVEALPEAPRRAVESWLDEAPPAEPARLHATGRVDRVGELPCRVLELREADTRRAEICEADVGTAGVSAEALATLRELVVFGGDVAPLLPSSSGSEVLAVLPVVEHLEGVPLRVRAWPVGAAPTETRIVGAVPANPAPDRFQAPPGYRPGLGIQVGGGVAEP